MPPKVLLAVVTLLAAGSAVLGIAIAPGQAHVHPADPLQAGLAALDRGDLDAANADFRAAVQRDPTSVPARFDLGVVLARQGNAAGARAAYTATLALAPAYTPALFNLAVLETDDDPLGATDLYRRILQLKPDDADTLFNLGLLLVSGGDSGDGTDLVRRAVGIDPTLRARVPSDVHL